MDAWQITKETLAGPFEEPELAYAELAASGPVRAAIRFAWRYRDSLIEQEIALDDASPALAFRTSVDWKEKQRLLKAAFETSVDADVASFDIAFGSVERSTRDDTPRERAQFEVPAHEWADLSDARGGLSLLNDCKYGHDCKRGTLRLTLLKSPIWPDAGSDREEHRFAYAVLPHAGGWREAGTFREARAFNVPPILRRARAHDGGTAGAVSLLSLECGHASVETVKPAEDGRGIVARVVEREGRPAAKARLRTLAPIGRVVACDMLENDRETLAASGEGFDFPLRPWEIRTFRILFREDG
jgi:alpha-mannosidase